MSISEFKAKCLAVLEGVRTSGRPLLITRRGTPVATITPPPPHREGPAFGAMRGTAEINGDLRVPVGEVWDALA